MLAGTSVEGAALTRRMSFHFSSLLETFRCSFNLGCKGPLRALAKKRVFPFKARYSSAPGGDSSPQCRHGNYPAR